MSCPPSDLEAQLDSPSLPEAPTIVGCQLQIQLPAQKRWGAIVQGVDESYTFVHVPLRHTDTGEQVWARLRHHVCSASLAKRLTFQISMLFTETVAGTGTIRKVQMLGNTQRNACPQVSLHDFELDYILTEAFHNPNILLHDINHLANYDRFSIKPSSNGDKSGTQDVIVIRKVLNKAKIAWLLIFLLIISPGLGLVVGLCTHKAEVGIAVSAGVFALASFLQGLAAWFHG